MDLKSKELTMRMKKAEASIAELEYKIEERKLDIDRMEKHIELQKEIINECVQKLGENNG